jgi:SAM-dependent methyltransferase
MTEYASLADVYEFLLPEPLLTPEGNVEAFARWIEPLPAGARVLDCACGIGLLAVGLAQRGFEAHASDRSPQMIERTRALAARHGVDVHAHVRAWSELPPEPAFDAVFCVGNSIAHAQDRVAALSAMRRALVPGGLLVLTSRNWELELAAGTRLEVDDRLTVRDGRRALVTRAWVVGESSTRQEVAVSILHDDGTVTTIKETLRAWPFRHSLLIEDLRATGLSLQESTFDAGVSRYLVAGRCLNRR